MGYFAQGRSYPGFCKLMHVTARYMTCIHNVKVPGRGFKSIRAGLCRMLHLNFREFIF
jgi:hypothetical protein